MHRARMLEGTLRLGRTLWEESAPHADAARQLGAAWLEVRGRGNIRVVFGCAPEHTKSLGMVSGRGRDL